jgi:hypothetical protein
MRHFIAKMISTSTEKEEEREDELIGTDVERGFIDFARTGRGQGVVRFARPGRETDHYKNINL